MRSRLTRTNFDTTPASTETGGETAPLLTVREVAEWLRMKPSTIYDWAAAGRLPCLRLRGRLRFLRGDVARWIEAHRET